MIEASCVDDVRMAVQFENIDTPDSAILPILRGTSSGSVLT